MNKVIVIGLDGFEPKIAEAMMDRGELPTWLIKGQGGSTRLKTTYPAQTPVAWSTFSTGTNPGGHGIFDFLGRDPKTYLPLLALSRYEQKNAFVPPKVVNQRRGTPVWKLLSDAGDPLGGHPLPLHLPARRDQRSHACRCGCAGFTWRAGHLHLLLYKPECCPW